MEAWISGARLPAGFSLLSRSQGAGTPWLQGELWSATQIRDNQVVWVSRFREGDLSDLVDAARRASVLTDRAVVPVIAAGRAGADESAYVVTRMPRAKLAALSLRLEAGEVLGPPARLSLVRSVANVVHRASHFGIHHGALRPEVILCDPEVTDVQVAGFEVDRVLRSASTTEHDDVTGIVRIAHALTLGTWPQSISTTDQATIRERFPTLESLSRALDSLDDPADLDSLFALTGTPVATASRVVDLSDVAETSVDVTDAPLVGSTALATATTTTKRDERGAGGGHHPPGSHQSFQTPLASSVHTEHQRSTPHVVSLIGDQRARKQGDHPVPSTQNDVRSNRGLASVPRQVSDLIEGSDAAYLDGPRPTSEHTQKVLLGGLAGAMLLAMVVASLVLFSGGSDDSKNTAAPAPSSAATPSAAQPSSAPGGTASPGTAPAALVTIVEAIPLDPQGEDGENDSQAGKVFDGNPSSFWPSSTYRSADFGGLKDGVGIALKLSAKVPVNTVVLNMNGTGGNFEIRTAPDAGLGGSEVVGTIPARNGPAEVKLSKTVTTEYLLIWCTELPKTSGGYRIELNEVTLK